MSTTATRKRYFMNGHTTPKEVGMKTKEFMMTALYQGMRKMPVVDFAHQEIHTSFHFGYHCFDVVAEESVHKAFQEDLTGKVHAVSVLVLTEVEGEFKWEPTTPTVLS